MDILQNEIAALAGGDFRFRELSGLTSSGLGTLIVANWSHSSSPPDELVDILEPVMGVEPTARGIPSPEQNQSTGFSPLYHDIYSSSL